MAFTHDVRYAARALRRSAGFTSAGVLTLGLAIGATTAIFQGRVGGGGRAAGRDRE